MVIKLRLISFCFNLLLIFTSYFPLVNVSLFGPPINEWATVSIFANSRALLLFLHRPMISLHSLFLLVPFIFLPLLKSPTIKLLYHQYNPSSVHYFPSHHLLYYLLRQKFGHGGVSLAKP